MQSEDVRILFAEVCHHDPEGVLALASASAPVEAAELLAARIAFITQAAKTARLRRLALVQGGI